MRRALLLLCIPVALWSAPVRAQFGDDMGPPPPPPEEAEDQEPPAQAPDQETFEQQLSPYGRWVDTPEYGRVWIPSGVGDDWQPYTDGQWVDTDWGWSFESDDPWGWAAYHYGRWGFWPDFGWFWVPGFTWAPAWVAWRWSDGYACWSALAPHGFRYDRAWPGWVAIDRAHFTRPISRYAVPRSWSASIVRGAHPIAGMASRGFAARGWSMGGAGTRWWASGSGAPGGGIHLGGGGAFRGGGGGAHAGGGSHGGGHR